MRRLVDTPAHGRAPIIALALVTIVVMAVSGCKSLDTPNTETGSAVDSTWTVQAEIPTPSVEPTAPISSTGATVAPQPAAPTLWPAKVGKYAKGVKIPVWFPKTVPSGYKIDTVDVLELDTYTGFICDIIYLNCEKVLIFTQGSPKERMQDIVSAGKVPCGTDTADVVYQDPEDPSSPPMIVYYKGGNYAELQGDLSLAQLKAVAASMVRVK